LECILNAGDTTVHPNNFGACIQGVSLQGDLDAKSVKWIRQIWLDYQVVYFPNQVLTHDDLERFTRHFGEHGHDPYVKALQGHPHILEIRREPDEEPAPFGSSWHSDWSFARQPPAATILHAKTVPPIGGDTLYADGYRAFDALDPGLAEELTHLTALHSARRPYSHEGYRNSGGDQRSMTILPSDKAWDIQEHPVIRTHPETGRQALWVNPVYTIGIKELPESEAETLLAQLFAHALNDAFIYRHRWAENMLTMWDNRSVQHCAQGGYDGYLRIMHRTTIAGDKPA
jgi:alpha-ketoglutarate-dependent taurine dioxygenase